MQNKVILDITLACFFVIDAIEKKNITLFTYILLN